MPRRNSIVVAMLLAISGAQGDAIVPGVREVVPQPPSPTVEASSEPSESPERGADAREAAAWEVIARKQATRGEQLSSQIDELAERVEGLRPRIWDKWLPAIFGLIGAIVGSVAGYFLQRQRLEFDRNFARQAAGIKEVSEIKSFRSRQLNEFYAPLEALLRQGLEVRNELYNNLLEAKLPRISFHKMADEKSAARWSLGIKRGRTQLIPFRLIEEMAFVERNFPHLMSVVGEIVRINSVIVDLVHSKVGLVLHYNTDLSQTLAVFLAHQSVLENVYRSSIDPTNATVVVPGFTRTFPKELDLLVHRDCEKLRQELKLWQEDVSRWMEEITTDPLRANLHSCSSPEALVK